MKPIDASPVQQPEAVLFDLDGTLVDTFPDLADALDFAVRDAGAGAVDRTRLRPLISRGTREMIASVLPSHTDNERFDGARRRFLARYSERIAVRSRLFPGIESVLRTLEERGVRWGIVTNKHAWLTEPLLAELDLRRRAHCVVSGDSTAHPKPHPAPLILACDRLSVAPGAAVYVGDSRSDIESGRAAGVTTVSAGWGYLDPNDPPQRWEADVDIETPDELFDWVRGMFVER